MRPLFLAVLSALMSVLIPQLITPASAMDMRAMESHGRYRGAPDLQLTAAFLAAGGGATNFHATRLTHMLTGTRYRAEIHALIARFGVHRVRRYLATFDAFIADAVAEAEANHVALPPANAALAQDPYELAASLRRAGVMPDGRFDIGFFVEHLVSRPIHVAVMHRIDGDAHVGATANADFHVILTAEMNDLKALYHLPR